jgi:hypothetical protein
MVAICDEMGKTIGLRGVSVDITDRKHAEEDLRKRTEELKEAQRIAVVGSWSGIRTRTQLSGRKSCSALWVAILPCRRPTIASIGICTRLRAGID